LRPSHENRAADGPSLSDPVTCGEDLAFNSRRAMELAPRFCGTCEDHHLLSPVRRLAVDAGNQGVEIDRPRLFEIIAGLINRNGKVDGHSIDIVIAGSVDTALLASCAHAAHAASGGAFSRVRFTVLDLCRTPLELCREFAARHDLPFTTDAVNLLETENVYPADILLNHSLFRYLPFDRHVATLQKLGSWLKPDGRIVFSTSIKPAEHGDTDFARRSGDFDRIRDKVRAGVIQIHEPEEAFYARFRRYLDSHAATEFESSAAVRKLFAAAGMKAESFEELSRSAQLRNGGSAVRRRVVAVIRMGTE
jgi:SAM-dependent methyltransferase